MIEYLHNSDFSIKIDTCDFELAFFDFVSKLWVEPVVACKLLGHFLSPICSMQKRAR